MKSAAHLDVWRTTARHPPLRPVPKYRTTKRPPLVPEFKSVVPAHRKNNPKVVTGITWPKKIVLQKSRLFLPPKKNHGSQNPWFSSVKSRSKSFDLGRFSITFQAMARTGGNVQHSPKSSADSPLWKQHGSVHPPAAQRSIFDGFFTTQFSEKHDNFLKADKKRERLRFQVQTNLEILKFKRNNSFMSERNNDVHKYLVFLLSAVCEQKIPKLNKRPYHLTPNKNNT